MNLLAKGKALRDRLMKQDATPEGTLSFVPKADPDNPVDLTGLAWFGNTRVTRLPNQGAAQVVYRETDLMVPRTAISAEPIDGDRVIWTVEDRVVTFEVAPITGEPGERWSDSEQTLYRLHLKEVT